MDTTRLGQVAAELMEVLVAGAEQLETDGERVELGDVMILAEVRGQDSDGGWTHITFRCTDERVWVQRGMLHGALEMQREPGPPIGDDEDDDGEA